MQQLDHKTRFPLSRLLRRLMQPETQRPQRARWRVIYELGKPVRRKNGSILMKVNHRQIGRYQRPHQGPKECARRRRQMGLSE